MYAKHELSEKNGTITTNLNVSTVIFRHVVRVIPIASTSVLGVRIEYTMPLRGVDSSGFTPKSGRGLCRNYTYYKRLCCISMPNLGMTPSQPTPSCTWLGLCPHPM